MTESAPTPGCFAEVSDLMRRGHFTSADSVRRSNWPNLEAELLDLRSRLIAAEAEVANKCSHMTCEEINVLISERDVAQTALAALRAETGNEEQLRSICRERGLDYDAVLRYKQREQK